MGLDLPRPGYSAAGTYKLWVTLNTSGSCSCHMTRRVYNGIERLDWRLDNRHFSVQEEEAAAHDVYALMRLAAQQFSSE